MDLSPSSNTSSPSICSLIAGITIALVTGWAAYNTTLNNAYQYGMTVWDSAIFATTIWRSGWTLLYAPVFGAHVSCFTTHASLILLLPDLFSYIFPGDRLTYYALAYGLLYAVTTFVVYRLIAFLIPSQLGPPAAAIGAFALFCSRVVFGGSWEMRIDYASVLFVILAFQAWQCRKYRQAMLWLLLNAAVREDLGIVFAFPLGLLATIQYVTLRTVDASLAQERGRQGIILCLASLCAAGALITFQKTCFPIFDLFHDFYYSKGDMFGHLNRTLLAERLSYHYKFTKGLWVPWLVLIGAAVVLRDAELIAAPVGLMPYSLAMLLAKMPFAARLDCYKAFPLALIMLWPALVGSGRPASARPWQYVVLQFIVLCCGIIPISMAFIPSAIARWTPQPMTHNAQLYRDFGKYRLDDEHPFSGHVRASQGVVALYPYQFPVWWKALIGDLNKRNESDVDTLIWFQGDRDEALIKAVLSHGAFTSVSVPGTKISIAHRIRGTPEAPCSELDKWGTVRPLWWWSGIPLARRLSASSPPSSRARPATS